MLKNTVKIFVVSVNQLIYKVTQVESSITIVK